MSHDFETDRANGDLDLLEGWRAQNRRERYFALAFWVCVWSGAIGFWAGVVYWLLH